ncbi:helix-turn-helix transcriptional regulator [Lysobacter tyrosinilyticus]
MDLALKAGLSPRHLSFVETGRSQPSAHMVLRLAEALDLPLRERNALLIAAGYAPRYPESPLAMPELSGVRRAVDYILQQQEPYPAFLVNRYWDVLGGNAAAERLGAALLGGRPSAHGNMIRQAFDPNDLRAIIVNWEEVAGDLIRHLHAIVAASPGDHIARGLLEEALAYPDVPAQWRRPDLIQPPSPVLTTVFSVDGRELRFFSTITTFASAGDVTLQELHIESCFPMDEVTADFCRGLATMNTGSLPPT